MTSITNQGQIAPLHIAHVTATFPPYHGGTGRVCYHNACELARRGHDVHVFTAMRQGAAPWEDVAGIAIHRLRPWLRVGNAPVLPGLVRALRGFDIIHLHYPFFGGEFAALAARLAGIPLVITYHNDVILSGPMRIVASALEQTVGRLTLRSAARLLFTSLDYAGASAARRFLRGRELCIGELPNGVDSVAFAAQPSNLDLRARHGIAADARMVLLVARLDRAHYFKGVDIFLAALARTSGLHGIIVGDGDMRQDYETRANAFGLDGRVTFAGAVSDNDLPGYYQLADVAVLPSTTMGEAFGLVLVESMAAGTPVIATSLPGVRSVVEHGVDGFLVPPGDAVALASALDDLLGDEMRRVEMGQQGQRKVRTRYDWAQLAVQLENIYGEVARRKAHQGRPLEEMS